MKQDPNRWQRAAWGGKSPLQRDLEQELAEKRATLPPKEKRPPLKWYFWVLIAVGALIWIGAAFYTDSRIFESQQGTVPVVMEAADLITLPADGAQEAAQ